MVNALTVWVPLKITLLSNFRHEINITLKCLSTIEDYTTLKQYSMQYQRFVGLSTIEDYTTLKPQILKFEETASTTMR